MHAFSNSNNNVLVDPKGLFDFVLNFLQISSRQDPLKYSPVPFYQLRQRTALKVEEVAESYMILTILEVRLETLNSGPLTIGKTLVKRQFRLDQ